MALKIANEIEHRLREKREWRKLSLKQKDLTTSLFLNDYFSC